MARQCENTGFACVHCGAEVQPVTNGSYRNHCPFCLWSLHVDNQPGDRLSRCRAPMQPVAVVRNRKGWQIVHQCTKCGHKQPNKVAQMTLQDDMDALVRFMRNNNRLGS
ncbi:MAG: RNHCP domain-containing protein [Pseudomonadota bacterium]